MCSFLSKMTAWHDQSCKESSGHHEDLTLKMLHTMYYTTYCRDQSVLRCDVILNFLWTYPSTRHNFVCSTDMWVSETLCFRDMCVPETCFRDIVFQRHVCSRDMCVPETLCFRDIVFQRHVCSREMYVPQTFPVLLDQSRFTKPIA